MNIQVIVDDLKKHPTKTYRVRNLSAIKGIAIHHTVGVSNPWNVAIYHVDTRCWPGIGYHFYIMEDGTIYQTNWLTTISYHVGNPNGEAVGIALNGNFMDTPPTQAQLDATRYVVDYICKTDDVNVEKIHGHGQYPGGTVTACPGATWPIWLEYVKEPLEDGWVEFIPFLELLDEPHGKIFTDSNNIVGEKYHIKEGAKKILARVAVTGSQGGWASIGHKADGAYASLLSAYVPYDNVPGSDTSYIPVDADGNIYFLYYAPPDKHIKVWVRIYGYYK